MSHFFYTLQKLVKAILYILCFPYILYLGWKKEKAFNASDWERVITSLKNIQRFGGLSPRDLFLLGYAHSNLGRIDEAIRFIEIIQTPLEDINEEACRYCTHAWLLYKLGKHDQSKAILEHAMSEKWPAYRLEWAKDFLNSIKSDTFLDDNAFRPRLSVH